MDLGRRFGDRPSGAGQAGADKKAVKRSLDSIWTSEICIVHSYNFQKQTVNVALKNRPDAPLIKNVPIAGAGGELRIIRSFETVVGGSPNPTVGIVVFTKSSPQGATASHVQEDPKTKKQFSFNNAIYMGNIPASGTAAWKPIDTFNVDDDAGWNPDVVGPKDDAIVHKSGSRIVFKANGDIILQAGRKVFIGSTLGSDVSTYDEAARKGDSTSVSQITGGSQNVMVGD